MDDPAARLAEVYDATTRYLRTLDGLTSATLDAPSLLPGWTRGYVVAHIARHAYGFAASLEGLLRGEPQPVYASRDEREVGIAETAALSFEELREASFDACGRWRQAAEASTGRRGVLSLFPEGPRMTVDEAVEARWREVEIHHADLDLGYGRLDWPEAFVDAVFNTVVDDRQDGPSMLLRTPDGDVLVGCGYGPAVTGSRRDLAWWLLGRGRGDGLTCDTHLPTLDPWTRRTPAR